MENTLQNRPETLVSELGNWNRQENKFKELFSADALKDREFIRMKLEHYNGLHHKYNGTPKTTDERAMMMVLRFQRRKMERSLYPGLLTRLFYRGRVRLRAMLTANRESIRAERANAQQYITPTPSAAMNPNSDRQATVRQMKTPKFRRFNRQANKNHFRNNRKKGRSI